MGWKSVVAMEGVAPLRCIGPHHIEEPGIVKVTEIARSRLPDIRHPDLLTRCNAAEPPLGRILAAMIPAQFLTVRKFAA